MKRERGLRIKTSTIPNAGLGLYTSRIFDNNALIDSYYNGCVQETKQAIHDRYGDEVATYVWCGNKQNCRDAKSTQSNYVRYSNSCTNPNDPRDCNAIINNVGNLRALRLLEPNEEILVDYGAEYLYE
ncbi:MAG: SET domain-containing protein [Sphingobacteriaceae bacterium]|nr:MAG: SET domain-containing protein [Sphingobacteriaceae bacterium]